MAFACEATLENQYQDIHFSLVYMLYLQKVLLVHSKKYVFYMIYRLKLPLRLFPSSRSGVLA